MPPLKDRLHIYRRACVGGVHRGPSYEPLGRAHSLDVLPALEGYRVQFRARAESAGSGYQTLINAELRGAVARASGKEAEPLTVAKLREVIRQELAAA